MGEVLLLWVRRVLVEERKLFLYNSFGKVVEGRVVSYIIARQVKICEVD